MFPGRAPALARRRGRLLRPPANLRPVEPADGLDPAADPATWADRLQRETEDTMLVGHLPYLERLASRLLVGDPGGRAVAFRNAGAVCLEHGEGDRWVVRWSLPPEVV